MLHRSHVLYLLKTDFCSVWGFQDHKEEKSGVIKGFTWYCETNSIKPTSGEILHLKSLAKVQMTVAGPAFLCMHFSVSEMFLHLLGLVAFLLYGISSYHSLLSACILFKFP